MPINIIQQENRKRQSSYADPNGSPIDTSRPIVENPDGSFSTERSITVTTDGLNGGKPTNIPTIWDGKELPHKEAINRAIQSGNTYAAFNSIDEAVDAAKKRSSTIGQIRQKDRQPRNIVQEQSQAQQQEPNMTRSWPAAIGDFVSRAGADVGGGFLNSLTQIANTPHNVAAMISPEFANKHLPYDKPDYTEKFQKALGINEPNVADQLAEFTGNFAGFGPAGVEKLIATGIEKSPAALAAVSKIPFGKWMAPKAGAGTLYGATHSDNPLTGGIEGGGLNVAGGALGEVIGSITSLLFKTKAGQANAMNKILERLEKSYKNEASNSPEEAGKLLKNVYTTKEGKQMKVDVGTVANDPLLKGLYEAMKYIPFSGASKNMNVLKNQRGTKAVQEEGENLAREEATYAQQMKDYQGNQGDLTNEQAMIKLQQMGLQGQSVTTKDMLSELQNKISQTSGAREQHENIINQAPNVIDQLAEGITQRAENPFEKHQIPQALTSEVKTALKKEKDYYGAEYDRIKKNDIPMNPSEFVNYKSAAQELIKNRKSITELFGDDKELGGMIKSEITSAEKFLKSANKKSADPISLAEAIDKRKLMKKLARKANKAGERKEAMLIGNLGTAFEKDIAGILENTGNKDLYEDLLKTDTGYRENVIPFYSDPHIAKASQFGEIFHKGELAGALHDINNQAVLKKLSPETKRAAAFQFFTGGTGTTSGETVLTTRNIMDKNKSLSVQQKRLMQEYAPKEVDYLENLPNVVKSHKRISETQSKLEKEEANLNSQLDRVLKQHDAAEQTRISKEQKAERSAPPSRAKIEKIKERMNELENKRLGVPKEKSGTEESLLKSLPSGLGAVLAAMLGKGSALLGTPLAAKNLTEILSNPDLIQAFIKGEKIKVPATPKSIKAIKELPRRIITPTGVNLANRNPQLDLTLSNEEGFSR